MERVTRHLPLVTRHVTTSMSARVRNADLCLLCCSNGLTCDWEMSQGESEVRQAEPEVRQDEPEVRQDEPEVGQEELASASLADGR